MEDLDRAIVLAHERYIGERHRFDGLCLRERFELIYRINLWGASTTPSGLGSEDASAQALRDELPQLLAQINARSILDAPCGDAGWITRIGFDLEYTGMDIVPALIDANQLRAHRERFRGRFIVGDLTQDPLPQADVVLCRDCLVHLSFKNIFLALERFRASGAEWLLTTTFPEWRNNYDCEDGDWRALNFQAPPFSWPEPSVLINERCSEGDGDWKDKSLGLWRLGSLP